MQRHAHQNDANKIKVIWFLMLVYQLMLLLMRKTVFSFTAGLKIIFGFNNNKPTQQRFHSSILQTPVMNIPIADPLRLPEHHVTNIITGKENQLKPKFTPVKSNTSNKLHEDEASVVSSSDNEIEEEIYADSKHAHIKKNSLKNKDKVLTENFSIASQQKPRIHKTNKNHKNSKHQAAVLNSELLPVVSKLCDTFLALSEQNLNNQRNFLAELHAQQQHHALQNHRNLNEIQQTHEKFLLSMDRENIRNHKLQAKILHFNSRERDLTINHTQTSSKVLKHQKETKNNYTQLVKKNNVNNSSYSQQNARKNNNMLNASRGGFTEEPRRRTRPPVVYMNKFGVFPPQLVDCELDHLDYKNKKSEKDHNRENYQHQKYKSIKNSLENNNTFNWVRDSNNINEPIVEEVFSSSEYEGCINESLSGSELEKNLNKSSSGSELTDNSSESSSGNELRDNLSESSSGSELEENLSEGLSDSEEEIYVRSGRRFLH